MVTLPLRWTCKCKKRQAQFTFRIEHLVDSNEIPELDLDEGNFQLPIERERGTGRLLIDFILLCNLIYIQFTLLYNLLLFTLFSTLYFLFFSVSSFNHMQPAPSHFCHWYFKLRMTLTAPKNVSQILLLFFIILLYKCYSSHRHEFSLKNAQKGVPLSILHLSQEKMERRMSASASAASRHHQFSHLPQRM